MILMRKLMLLAVLSPAFAFSQVYKKYTLHKDKLSIELSEGLLTIRPLNNKSVRVQWEKDIAPETQEFVFVNNVARPAFKFAESAASLILRTAEMNITFNKANSLISFSDKKGKVFLSEKAGSRKLTPASLRGQACYVAELGFDSPKDEYLFGLGQFQDGHYNLRNITRKLIQVNSQIAIPFLYSSRGYGILWHQYGLTYFNPADRAVPLVKKESLSAGMAEVTTTGGSRKISQQQSLYTGTFTVDRQGEYCMMLDLGDMDNRHLVIIDGVPLIDQSNLWLPPAVSKLTDLKPGTHTVQVVCKDSNIPSLSIREAGDETVFRSPDAKSLDYVVFSGNNADDVISSYRDLSGKVPMLPLWAYGFWQCRERYTSGAHLVETVKQFRERKLPVDVIVQDWQYWGKYGWGVPKFDESNYPDPARFIKQLHDLNAHFSVSVWENLDKKSEVARDYVSKDLYIANSPWIDIYNPETRKTHWNALNKNLFSFGVDSWWMDATEPENDALKGKETYFGPGEFYRLIYPLFVSKAVYDGQRQTDPKKRVTILTRSAYPGQQRYGTINWSGDIGWNWDTFRRQIVAGLNYNLTGMPYWTTDIGGFFRPGPGQYTDEKYHDLLNRWYQWGAFNPIFRVHGYQSETEPWKYGEKMEANIRSILNTRYRLMPYIYSEAWNVSKNNSTIMRPMVMDFGDDGQAVQQGYQYMFGKSMLIAPVTKEGVSAWNVYLPKSSGWYDFWTGKRFEGGQTVNAAAPPDKLPVFVKAGSIIPLGKLIQHTGEKQGDTLEIRIYKGADAEFGLYEDEGDGYDYEKGSYSLIPFRWDEKSGTLSIGKSNGNYPGDLKKRIFNITFVKENEGTGTDMEYPQRQIHYTGRAVKFRE